MQVLLKVFHPIHIIPFLGIIILSLLQTVYEQLRESHRTMTRAFIERGIPIHLAGDASHDSRGNQKPKGGFMPSVTLFGQHSHRFGSKFSML